jgi:hypothetical protein
MGGRLTGMCLPPEVRALLAVILRGQDDLNIRSKLTKKYYLDRAQEYLAASYYVPPPRRSK